MEVKKKQHYVWKQYLKNWSYNEKQIYFLHKNSNEVKVTNLENIAQQRFFYEVDAFSENEESILAYLINEWSNDYSRDTNLALLKRFFIYSRAKRALDKLSIYDKEERLNVVKKNTLEDLHSIFEKFGEKLLIVNDLSDLSFFNTLEEKVKALIYLCIQYTRTNQMHSKAMNGLSLANHLPESSLKFIAVTFAITLASNLALVHKLRVTLLKNATNIDFITTDQPIINTKTDFNNPTQATELLEFYYPINPRVALLVSTSEENLLMEHEVLSKEELMNLNRLLINMEPDFIFSKSKEALVTILS
ncbi:DUF4238 domain-containing protein [Sphingobacterium gobiense]|uniref:DUF4238 domain-containing protein n=1 Tax=Sphingobacterium gobiense TaxID=1382456 RepID=A0A2S9JU07_9SPHI|nr:DUF4238 domain-containing protein [Sphingobacterium gobiense]PRD56777.1 hypothetical protein C5749_06000 [Sphingobacterium gobiense]